MRALSPLLGYQASRTTDLAVLHPPPFRRAACFRPLTNQDPNLHTGLVFSQWHS